MRFGEDEAIKMGKEVVKDPGAAGDGDGALDNVEFGQRFGERRAPGIPQRRQGIIRVPSQAPDGARHDQPPAAGIGMAGVSQTTKDDQRGAIERGLEGAPVGVVAERGRHGSFGGGDHAVGRHNGVALDADGG